MTSPQRRDLESAARPPGPTPHDSGVASRAEVRLHSHPYRALRSISCLYKDGVLILRGCLPSYYLVQIALASVMGLEGVRQVLNEVEVRGSGRRGAV